MKYKIKIYIKISLLLMFAVMVAGCLESSRSAPDGFAEKYEGKVVLYSTKWCGYCQKMRAYFTRSGIDYLEQDIEYSAAAYAEFNALGGKGIPLTLVKGRVVDGYVPKAVLEIVKEVQTVQ